LSRLTKASARAVPPGDQTGDERLLREHGQLIRSVAVRVARQIGSRLKVEELLSYGQCALLDAARTHDARRCPFLEYAALKMRWAMLDGARRETRNRRIMARCRALEASDRVLEDETQHQAAQGSQAEGSTELPETEEVYRQRLRSLLAAQAAALAVGLSAEPESIEQAEDPKEGPEALALRSATSKRLRSAVTELPNRERILVERHYFAGERFDTIADSLGLSKSWASRLHARAIRSLGLSLGSDADL